MQASYVALMAKCMRFLEGSQVKIKAMKCVHTNIKSVSVYVKVCKDVMRGL